MTKVLSLLALLVALSLAYPALSVAQGMMGEGRAVAPGDAGHTVREEAEGKAVWEKLQAAELTCKDLADDNFGTLGEYFMGQMMGASHEAMNEMMIRMLGEAGEKAMHVALGKRMSGCEPNAAMPQNMMNSGMMQMMGGGMLGNRSNPSALNDFINPMSMMNFGFAPLAWIFLILFGALTMAGIVALIKWIVAKDKTESSHRSALEILKERYAKGEIDKKEFVEKKEDIS